MKLKTILCLTFVLSFAAHAAESAAGLPERLLKRLESAINRHHPPLKTWDPAWGDPPPPPPPPKENEYETVVRKSAEEDGIPQSAVNAAIIALAEDYNSRLKQGVAPWEQGGWNVRCDNMFVLMRMSGDRGFLPCIEKIGTTSACWSVRVDAVRTHVEMCGSAPFPFMKRAMAAAASPGTEEERLSKGHMAAAFLGSLPVVSEEQVSEVCGWLLEQIGLTDDIFLLRMYDKYLLGCLPEYKHSRQRLALASKENIDTTNFSGGHEENMFIAVKAEIDAIPLSKRPDLRIRFPSLPPLPDDPAEAEASAAHIWLIAAVGVAALLAAVLALLRRAKKAGAA